MSREAKNGERRKDTEQTTVGNRLGVVRTGHTEGEDLSKDSKKL